jgi:hypothetical protein
MKTGTCVGCGYWWHASLKIFADPLSQTFDRRKKLLL